MKRFTSKYFLDIVFWISLLFYLDPAGWFRLNFSNGRFTQFYFYIIIIIVFIVQIFKAKGSIFFKDYWIKKYSRFLLLFLFYWLIIYCWLNTPMYQGGSVILPLFRTRRVIMELFLVYPVYYFTIRNALLFIKLFSLTTIIILSLYFASIFFSLDIVKINTFSRSFVDTSRNLLFGYGIMPFGVFLGIVTFFMPVKKNNVMKWLIVAGLFVVLMWIVTIVRREMVGVVLSVIITFFIFHYLFQRNYAVVFRKAITYFFVIVIVLSITFPNYLNTVVASFNTVYSSIFEKEKSSETDVKRVSLTANTFIIEKIKEYPIFGTGYLQKWYTSSGDDEGYEGSDYIFLATLAQNGFIGLTFFLAYYVLVFRLILVYFKIIKKNIKILLSNMNVFYPYLILLLSMSVFYIRHLISFPNWFYPIAAIADSPKFFIALGLMLGSARMISINIKKYKSVDSK